MFSGIIPVTTNESATPITKIVFQYVSIVPLQYMHDFFTCLPSVSRAEGVSLRLQMNIHKGKSWTIKYDRAAEGIMSVQTIDAQSSVGNCCPVLVSQACALSAEKLPNESKGTGLVIWNGPNNDPVLEGRCVIGYQGLAVTLGGDGHPNPQSSQCRLMIPQILFNSEKARQIIENPQMNLSYNDYYVDRIEKALYRGGGNVEKNIGVQLSKVRQFHIIPFLSSTAQSPIIYRSPLSSAPNTCSFCKIDSLCPDP
jgi:hypothetical protein